MARETGLNPGLVIGTTSQLLRAVDERTDSILRHGTGGLVRIDQNNGTGILQNVGGEASDALTLDVCVKFSKKEIR